MDKVALVCSTKISNSDHVNGLDVYGFNVIDMCSSVYYV